MDKTRLTINVTEECLKEGETCHDQKCAIALAVWDAVTVNGRRLDKVGGGDVSVSPGQVEVNTGAGKFIAFLPKRADAAMVRFDRGLQTEPFSFDLTFSPIVAVKEITA